MSGLRGLDLAVEVLAFNDVHPERWNQEQWLYLVDERGVGVVTWMRVPPEMELTEDELDLDAAGFEGLTLAGVEKVVGHPCHTVGCFAGNAVAMSGLLPLFLLFRHDDGQLAWSNTPMVKMPGGHLVEVNAAALLALELGDETVLMPCQNPMGVCAELGCGCEGIDVFGSTTTREDLFRALAVAYGLSDEELVRRVVERAIEIQAEEKIAAEKARRAAVV